MAHFIPFITAPLSFAWEACKQIKYNKLPSLFEKQPKVPEVPPRPHVLDLRIYPNPAIKEEHQTFLKANKIRPDLLVYEVTVPEKCCAMGNNVCKGSDAAIIIVPGLLKTDKEACNWVLKHEFNHIRANDLITIPLAGTICSTVAAAVGTMTMPWIPATMVTVSVGISALSFFSIWREGKADDFAIKNASNEELLGGRRMLIAFQRLASTKSFCKRIDLLHPTLKSRIQKIESAIKQRGILIDENQEDLKIKKIVYVLFTNEY